MYVNIKSKTNGQTKQYKNNIPYKLSKIYIQLTIIMLYLSHGKLYYKF